MQIPPSTQPAPTVPKRAYIWFANCVHIQSAEMTHVSFGRQGYMGEEEEVGKGGEGREGTYERETRTKQTSEERIGCHRRRCDWSIRRNEEPKDAGENENDAL